MAIGDSGFSLKRFNKQDVDRLRDEIIERVKKYDSAMSSFYGEWLEAANSWRMIPHFKGRARNGIFNSKSGETNRATNTLASLWFRMLTASDPYIEAYSMGLGEYGREYTESEIYSAREVILEQHRELKFKPKLERTLRSLALMGTVIVEKPWVSLPLGTPNKYFEGTDFQFRSLIRSGFDPFAFDLDCSDFVYTVDYLSSDQVLYMAFSGDGVWDYEKISSILDEYKNSGSSETNKESDAYARIQERRARAGYQDSDINPFELINYCGKLNSSNPVLIGLWEMLGRQDEIRFCDWKAGIINGTEIVRIHPAPYGSWKWSYETASINPFELESIGYGVGKSGQRLQRELDVTQSQSHDALALAVYTMWKVGKYAGLNENQIAARPFGAIVLDDINQMEQLKIDVNAVVQSLAMQGMLKEDFRAITGASTNLQAITTNATATEASLTQSEAIRGASVNAEIVAETLVRNYVRTMHINNYNLLDNHIYVSITGDGSKRTLPVNREQLPANIGFKIKVTTDKDYRPERLQKLLELINLSSSVRQILPDSINAIPALYDEAFRLFGIDPRLLRTPKPLSDVLTERAQRLGKSNALGLGEEMQGEISGEMAGSPNITTPVGPVPTSPVASSVIQ